MEALPTHPGLLKTLYTFECPHLEYSISACPAFRRDPGEVRTPTAALLALPFADSAGPESRRTVSVGLILLIIVLLPLFWRGRVLRLQKLGEITISFPENHVPVSGTAAPTWHLPSR